MSSRQETIREVLAQRRKDPDLAEALLRIDAVAQNWRRQIHKRELGQRALRALGLEIDLAQVDVLFAIASPAFTMEPNDEHETMVSTVAERLDIDPSRASRLVTEMVNAGYARRAVSQRDARRTILELTSAGHAVVDAVLKFKWLLLGEFFSGWSKDDIAVFVPLLERYSTWMRTSETVEEAFADDIAQLSRSIAKAKKDVPSSSKSG